MADLAAMTDGHALSGTRDLVLVERSWLGCSDSPAGHVFVICTLHSVVNGTHRYNKQRHGQMTDLKEKKNVP